MHSSDARLILHDVTYDAQHIYPHPALSGAQRAQLRYGMNVATNSVDTALAASPPGSSALLPLMNTYSAFVDGWAEDGSSIHVVGWTVVGGHDARGGQVPGGRLDRYWTDYPTRTCLFGAPTKNFSNVWVLGYDPSRDRYGVPTTSLVHRFEGLELDMYNEALSDYEASFHGMTINYSPHTVMDKGTVREHPVRPAADSYDLLLGGDGIQKILRLTGSPTSTEIDGTTLHVDGNTGLPSWSEGRNAAAETMESVTEADGNRLRIVTWGQRTGPGPGWRSASMSVGLVVDGAIGDPASGSTMGRVTFNPPGHPGGIAITTASGSALTVDDGGGVSFRAYAYRQLPGDAPAGANFFCSDCLAPGERAGGGTGMNVFRSAGGDWKTSAGTRAGR